MNGQTILPIRKAVPASLIFRKTQDSLVTLKNKSHGKEGEWDLSTLEMGGCLDRGKALGCNKLCSQGQGYPVTLMEHAYEFQREFLQHQM